MGKRLMITAMAICLIAFVGCSNAANPSDSSYSSSTEDATESIDVHEIDSEQATLEDCVIGDVVLFGEYEQDGNNYDGKEPIEWLVLEKKEEKLLLLSKYGLGCGPYNEEWTFTTWENCTLRSRLNGTFLREAFSSEEQSRIADTDVDVDLMETGTEGINPGNDTVDKIFVLSVKEVKKYFPSYSKRFCEGTKAYWQEIADNYPGFMNETGECDWYLRTLGESSPKILDSIEGSDWVACVNVDGSIGIIMTGWRPTAIRPALWVNI